MMINIEQWDPSFSQKLDTWLRALNPNIHQIENSIINWLNHCHQPTDIPIQQSLAEIKAIMRQLPNVEIEISNTNGKRRILVITKSEIGAERFNYVPQAEQLVAILTRN